MRLQTKTSIFLLAAFLSIIFIFSGFVYFSVANYSYEDFYRLLEIRAVTTAKTELHHEADNEIQGISDLRNEFFEKLPHEQDYIYPITPDATFEEQALALNVPLVFFESVLTEGKAEYNDQKLFYKAIKYTNTNGSYIIVASAENYFQHHHFAYLQKTLFVAIVVAFFFSLFASVFFSKYIFKPLHKITENVKQIGSENLHRRINLKNRNDEMDELAHTFNDMLNRIETSFETQNNFISNASHELRTPLTAIMGETDVILSKPRTAEEYVETLKIILDETEKLDKKTKALLFLAQTGFNGKNQKFDKVRVDQLLWDVKETLEKLNSKNKIHIDMSLFPENPVKLKVKGNEQLLHLALTNIISNACKYSDNQTVQISLGASDESVFIIVKDTGIGIPDNELKHIYDPFFRASNTKKYEGYGIGLPLTQNIIKMHKGEIMISSTLDKGTIVQIRLPNKGLENTPALVQSK